MERVYYAGDHIVTGTEIAKAVFDYAAALAENGSAASVQIPVRREDGSIGSANLLVGPASQLITEHIDVEEHEELIDEALVEHIKDLTARLSPVHPVAIDTYRDGERPVDYDWTDEV